MDRLELVSALQAALASNDVEYVHWKSNQHLDASLLGQTDLDLLVPERDSSVLESAVARLGFVRMLPPWERRLPGVDAFLGLDKATGTLLHLDVCHTLVVGEHWLKNNMLPVERWLLDQPTRLLGLPVPPPDKELVVLYVRAMMKSTWTQLARSRLMNRPTLSSGIVSELEWLSERVDTTSLEAAAKASGLPIEAGELTELKTRIDQRRLDWDYIRRSQSSLRRRMRHLERLPWHRAILKRFWLRLRTRRFVTAMGMGMPLRTLDPPGVLVAVVGADGSGKSRLTADLVSWLAVKLSTRHLYFGQPKSGFWFKALNKPGSLARDRSATNGPLAWAGRYSDAAKWMMLARRRRRLSQQAQRMSAEGVIVVAERYPLPEFRTMETPMDGPRLQRSDCPRSWVRYEESQYDRIADPDLVIVLRADLATLRSRKNDLGVEEHRAKVEAVEGIPPEGNHVVIDAGLPYEEVLVQAESALWEVIRATR